MRGVSLYNPGVPNTSDAKPVISLRNVVKRFGGQTVLDGITFDVFPGETMVVMGGSGSGKSTTLRCMIGTFRPDEGEIHLFGQNICGLRESAMNEVRKKFGILFQSGALFNSMTIYDNVALPIREHTDLDPDIIDIQVQIKLELVGLREAASKFPSEISGGMKKRAGLARALALDPKVLFYDEPSAGLDPVTSAQIDTLIVDLSKKLGVTSVVVTHEMDSAFTIADRMAMLDKGRMLTVQPRAWYDRLRKTTAEEAAPLPEDERLIRQFLRGEPEGPITQRKASASDFAEALFGKGFEPVNPRDTPSIQPSR